MRSGIWKIGLLCIMAWGASGLNCAGTGGPGFPKITTWDQRTVNRGAAVWPTVVAVADFDSDGLQDIAVGYIGNETTTPAVFVFFQTDVDTFTAVQLASDTDLDGVVALAIADLDADGHSDVVAACNGRIVYLHSPTDPRESAGWTLTALDQSSGTGIGQWNDVAVGDIDGANGPDIVACNDNVGRLAWFRGPADASSGLGWVRIDIDTTSRANAMSVALGNVTGGASRIDIYSTAPGETTARIAWYQNPSDPVGGTWTKTAIGNLESAAGLAIGDLSGDGQDDVVVTNPGGRRVGWYLRPSDPTDAWNGYVLADYTSDTPTDVQVADIDGNSQLDVVVATMEVGSLRWFTPIGSATLQWGENNLKDLDETVGRFAMADLDGDGRPDVAAPLLAATPDQDNVAWFENPEP